MNQCTMNDEIDGKKCDEVPLYVSASHTRNLVNPQLFNMKQLVHESRNVLPCTRRPS